jgi:hypothetical protein
MVPVPMSVDFLSLRGLLMFCVFASVFVFNEVLEFMRGKVIQDE